MKADLKKFILVFVILLMSCTTNGPKTKIINNDHKIYEIQSDVSKNLFEWGNKLIVEQIIPLETNSNSVIGRLNRGWINNSNIFIYETKRQKVVVFNNQGKFLFKIGQQGKGPGEYLELRDFMFFNNNIYFLDSKNIHCYDASNGEYKSSININTYNINPINFLYYNIDNYYICQANPPRTNVNETNYRLYKIIKGKVKFGYFEYSHRSFEGTRFFRGINNTFNMRPFDGDYKTYKIFEDSVSILFELDFKERSLPKDYFKKNPIDINNSYYNNDYFKEVNQIFETKNYLYFTCVGPKGFLFEGLINKKTDQISFGRWDYNYNPHIFYADDDFLYGYYEPFTFIEQAKKETDKIFFNKIVSNLKALNSADNLIIVKFSLLDI